MMKYFIKTYGCQYNEWDAARIDFMLQKIGFIPVSEKDAEIIFIVACAVRQTAVDRIFGKIRNWRDKKVIITGCILEQDQKKFQEKNAIIWDNNNPESLKKILKLKDKATLTNLMNLGNAQSVYVPIMTGCNNFCTYCVVPYTRGRETSRPVDDIVRDFTALVKKGEKNITLLGQNVNSYKMQKSKSCLAARQVKNQNDNLKFKNNFSQLLEILNNIPDDFKIYFTSNHPKDMDEDVIQSIAELPKVVKQIHLPLQSGSDKILRAMNRPYTKKQYLNLVTKIKQSIPNVEITTDVIIGFPGETEKDFQETKEIFKKVGYKLAYINKYSPRAGTVAYKLGDPIPWSEKQRRWRILDAIANKKG